MLGSIEDPDVKSDLIDADLKWRDRLIRELISLILAGVNMLLSNEELARLELMFTSGQVHSDPAIISDTDRMMDAMMMRAANMKAKSDINRHGFGQDDQANQHTAREAGTASEVLNLKSVDGKREKASPDSPSEGGLNEDWPPHTLEQLIQIRRSLMRNDDPSL